MDAVLMASLKISAGDVESMIHVPFLSRKADIAVSRHTEGHYITIGSRFVNPAINQAHGADPMPQTEQRVADEYSVPRMRQDAVALARRIRLQRHRPTVDLRKRSRLLPSHGPRETP